MIEALAKAGASIQELNTFRKYFSRTKGGKLAEAAYPAQVSGVELCLFVCQTFCANSPIQDGGSTSL